MDSGVAARVRRARPTRWQPGSFAPLLALWQPMPAIVGSVDAPVLRWSALGVALAGWAWVFASSLAIDPLELLGLIGVCFEESALQRLLFQGR
jgi:hypothetical protein